MAAENQAIQTVRSRRVRLVAAVVAAGFLLLTACDDAYAPSDPSVADLGVSVKADGSIDAALTLAPLHADHLGIAAEKVAAALFGSGAAEVRIEGSTGYGPAVATEQAAYQQGPRPAVTLELKEAQVLTTLGQFGITSVEVIVCAPRVAHEFDVTAAVSVRQNFRCVFWDLRAGSGDLTIHLVMHPRPGRRYASQLLLLTGLASVVVGTLLLYRQRRRGQTRSRWTIAATALPGLVYCVLLVLGLAGDGDDVAVAGHWGGRWLEAAGIVSGLVAFAVFSAGCAIAGMALSPEWRPPPPSGEH